MSCPGFDPRALLADRPIGVLATIRPDGRPQLSPVMPHYDVAGDRILVSTQEGLVKTRNTDTRVASIRPPEFRAKKIAVC